MADGGLRTALGRDVGGVVACGRAFSRVAEMQNAIADIRVRAERRMGEMLGEMTVKGGERHKLHDETYDRVSVLSDLGVSKSQSHRWQTMARLPDRNAAKLWIIENQLSRRNLTTWAACELAEHHEAIIAEQAKERQRESGKVHGRGQKVQQQVAEPLPQGDRETRTIVAKAAGMSHDTYRK